MSQENALENAPLFPLLVKLAVPSILSQLIVISYNFIDRIYLGRLADSQAALAALGIVVPIITILFSFVCLLGRGGSPLSSIQLGAHNQKGADTFISNTLSLLIIVSLLAMVIIFLFSSEILFLFGARDNVLEMATSYLLIYNIGTPFFFISMGLNYFITSQGFAKVAMMSSVIGSIANVFLNPVFIFWFDLGVAGAAIATVISQFMSFLWVMRFCLSKESLFKISLPLMRLQSSFVKKIIVSGSGSAFMFGTEAIILICFNAQFLRFGSITDVSIMTMMSSLFLLVSYPVHGIMYGVQPVLSYNYGAKNFDRIKKTLKILFKVNTSYSIFMASLMIIFPAFFLRFFTNDAHLIEQASGALSLYIVGATLFGLMLSCQETYTALGDGSIALFFAILRKIVTLVPLIYLLPYFFNDKIFAVILAEPISDALVALINACFFMMYIKKKLPQ